MDGRDAPIRCRKRVAVSRRWAAQPDKCAVCRGSQRGDGVRPATGSQRTAFETETGQFYAENPAVWTSRNVANIAIARQLSLADSARYFAQMFVTIADSLITTWNSKYYFNFWRPSTAIAGADSDGNPDTASDPSWTPLVPTPCHPEYPAGHGAGSGGLAHGLEQFFGSKKLDITLTSTSVPGQALAQHQVQQDT